MHARPPPPPPPAPTKPPPPPRLLLFLSLAQFQTGQRLYDKDIDFSYKPFYHSILGTGLVTANGAAWQKQRLLMAPALRIDMLDAIIPIAKQVCVGGCFVGLLHVASWWLWTESGRGAGGR